MVCMSDVPSSSWCHNPAERPVSVPLHPVSRRIGVHSLVLSSGRIFVTRSGYTVGDSTSTQSNEQLGFSHQTTLGKLFLAVCALTQQPAGTVCSLQISKLFFVAYFSKTDSLSSYRLLEKLSQKPRMGTSLTSCHQSWTTLAGLDKECHCCCPNHAAPTATPRRT